MAELSAYALVSSLDGTERLLLDQARSTRTATPAQLAAYINAGGSTITQIIDNTAGFAGDLLFMATPNTAATAGANVIRFQAAAVDQFRVNLAGEVFANGGVSTTGAGFAEYLQWMDGNPGHEDRTGWSVGIVQGHIVRAKDAPGLPVIGVVSARAAFIGNASPGRDIDPSYAVISGLGQEYVLKGESVDARWVRMGEVDAATDLWWIR